MLLQSIVEQLDRELDRLEQLRKLVAGLSRTPALLSRLTAEPAINFRDSGPEHSVLQPKRGRKPRSDAGQRRGYRTTEPKSEERALGKAVPKGPVVFSPQQLAAARASKEQEKGAALLSGAGQVTQPLDLDAQGRALALRWSASMSH